MLGQKINSFSVKGFLQGIFSCSNTIERPNLWYTNSRCSIMQTRKFERENATQYQYPWRTSYVQRPDQTREVHWLRCPPTFQSLERRQKNTASQLSTLGDQELEKRTLTKSGIAHGNISPSHIPCTLASCARVSSRRKDILSTNTSF